MVWDPTQPPTGAPLLSAPIRANFLALDALMQGAGGTAAYPLLAPDGVLAAPSYSFAGAPGMGLFRAADDQLTLVGADGARLFFTTEADPDWGETGFSFGNAHNAFFSFGSWENAPGDVRTAMYVFSPSQTDSFAVHIVDGSGVVSLSVRSHLHLVAHGTTTPFPEVRWVLNGNDGSLAPGTANVYDLGAPATPIRNLYLGTSLEFTALASAPATPPAGRGVLYLLAADKKLYLKNDAGVATALW